VEKSNIYKYDKYCFSPIIGKWSEEKQYL